MPAVAPGKSKVPRLYKHLHASWALALMILLGACGDAPNATAPNPAANKTAPKIPQVVTSDVKPWGFADQQGKHQGMLVDFQRTLFARAGIEYKNNLQPYPRVIHAISTGYADVAVMFSSPMANEAAVSLGHVLTVPIVIVVMANNTQDFKSLDDFNGMVVGHVRGSKYGEAFDNNPNFERVSIPHVDQALRMLKAGRIDAMAATKQSLLYAMHETGFAGESLRIALPLFEVHADLYVSRGAAQEPWVQPLKATLDAMRADGSLTPSFYQSPHWPYFELCFHGNQCIATQ
ncbi:transporter substrate-binding domain-containing protein [Simiduia sp. 21SJ11W-1]|uniref:substrate-binding periplasmic protein n=1 Tax=Simiduia sp. 21SJ11W-1 TaxID=2909669 RepID=UPI00209FFDF1|nr:transporter substrate-binding domain-containing protein [Simiduia sp. 21SJ11W-1]UTA48398.1 transporter substrate-binding domain-containing protein [Simiduia sp. 21SJ11W-1]